MTDINKNILVSVAWPYANGRIHIGHLAGCYLPADIFARFNRMIGNNVLMVSGSDAHGTPVVISALQENKTPEMEWDVQSCKSFYMDAGKWMRLRPHEKVPT